MNLIIKFKSLITKALKVFGNAEITGNISANDISIINLGTVSLPSYTFTIDPNTGMWSPAADTLAWSTNGVERMRVDSSGNVGIGTTTPSAKLHIEDSTLATVRVGSGTRRINLNSYAGDWNYQTSNGAPYVFGTADNNQLLFYQNNQERMRIQTGGNVGIGTTTPSEALTVSGNIGASGNIIVGGNINNAGSDVLFDDDVQFDGAENTMPNQTLDAGNSSVMTLGLSDPRYGLSFSPLKDENMPIVNEIFEDFVYASNPSSILLSNAFGSAGLTFSPLFADLWNTSIGSSLTSFEGQDQHTHRGISLIRGPSASDRAGYCFFHAPVTSLPQTNPYSGFHEFTMRAFFLQFNSLFTDGFFKIGPVPKGGTGGGAASLFGGLMFNPYLHPTNLVVACLTAQGATNLGSTRGLFSTSFTAGDVAYMDTEIPFAAITNKWVNIKYYHDFSNITIEIIRENAVIYSFTAAINSTNFGDRSTYVTGSGASREIGFAFGNFTYGTRLQLFLDYLLYRTQLSASAPPAN